MAIQQMGSRATESAEISPPLVLELFKKHVSPLCIKRLVDEPEADLFACSPATLPHMIKQHRALLVEMLRMGRVFKFGTLLSATRLYFDSLQLQRNASSVRATAYGLKQCCMHIGVVARRSTTWTRLAPEVAELVAILREHDSVRLAGNATALPVSKTLRSMRRLLKKRSSQSSGASPVKKRNVPPTSEELAAMYGRPGSSSGDVVCLSSFEEEAQSEAAGSQSPIHLINDLDEGKTFFHSQWGCSVLALADGSVMPLPKAEAKCDEAQPKLSAKAKAKKQVAPAVPVTGSPPSQLMRQPSPT